MYRQSIRGLAIGLLLVGCSSTGGNSPDAYAPQSRPDAAVMQPATIDGGCDEDMKGTSYCIVNPGLSVNGVPVGGGTRVQRQQPMDPQLCRQ